MGAVKGVKGVSELTGRCAGGLWRGAGGVDGTDERMKLSTGDLFMESDESKKAVWAHA